MMAGNERTPSKARGSSDSETGDLYLAVSRGIVVSVWVMLEVSVMVGAIPVVSAPDVVPFLSPQPASTRTAAINRIVFIVTPSRDRWW
jgi:hypothetical protein